MLTRRPTASPLLRPALLLATVLATAPAAVPVTQTPPGQTSLDDGQIVSALEGEYFAAQAVPASSIDASVEDGIVTLDGTVPDILAKERAVRIARMLKGVRAVVDRLQVRASGRDDDAIRQDVLAALQGDPATDAWELDVGVDDGIVTLGGWVDSHAERDLAGTVAKGVRGVRGLENQVVVEDDSERPDAEIRKEIEQRLAWDARVDDHLVSVAVQDGTVTLDGTVGSAHERALARSDAWVAGVDAVDVDALDVAWWARDPALAVNRPPVPDDGRLQAAVRDALVRDPRVLGYQPAVDVHGGEVTLRGQVGSVKARRSAAQDARNTVGVWHVRNLLKVRPSDEPSDEAIAANVRAGLERDPIVTGEQITVTVDDGEVRLTGHVGSYFARAQADDAAARVKGVTDVHNRLVVDYTVPTAAMTWEDWDPVLYDYAFDRATVRSRPDREIRADIESELWWSPFVDEDQVDVSVTDGVATLTGTVGSWRERAAASTNALEGGAIEVINRLKVDEDLAM